ncbi:MAG: hypothetical protein CM1200mP33_2390 [Chloroflexota bacterium]|nr:MAG: hypothetical protein CM1200mP33_2390 [Chloroflexota bacterium]
MPNAGLDQTRSKVADFLTKTTNHHFELSNVLMTGGAGSSECYFESNFRS